MSTDRGITKGPHRLTAIDHAVAASIVFDHHGLLAGIPSACHLPSAHRASCITLIKRTQAGAEDWLNRTADQPERTLCSLNS